MAEVPRVTLMVPTLRRPASLDRALQSIAGLKGVDGLFEVVVVDNDRGPSAWETVGTFAARAPFPVRYVHEPEPGVATARNAGMVAARAPLVAFLDDDETAAPGWLAGLLAVQAAHDADAVFGPVEAVVPEAVRRHRAYFQRFFSRLGPSRSGPMDGYFGCGNSLVRRAAMPDPQKPFAAERNRMGGEDDLLFGRMKTAGARFAWAAEARVFEHPEAHRLTLAYTLRRAFAYGQGPSAAVAARRPSTRLSRWIGIAGWMAVGAGQAVLFAAGSVAARLTGGDWVAILDRAAQGLGKVLWFGPFKIGFYGADAPGTVGGETRG